MEEEATDIVEQLHGECVERRHAQQRLEREAVEAMFRQALEQERTREREEEKLVEQVHQQAIDQYRHNPPPSIETRRGVHYTELAEAKPNEPLASEWNTYRREVGRLLAQGQEGRHIVIKGEEIIGLFDTSEAAYEAGWQRCPGGPFFIHEIRTEEPFIRIRGSNHPWPRSASR